MTGRPPILQGPLVERRRQERRSADRQLAWDASADMEDRRLGLGRRWDDWRRKQVAS
jgi:hypothetical protein